METWHPVQLFHLSSEGSDSLSSPGIQKIATHWQLPLVISSLRWSQSPKRVPQTGLWTSPSSKQASHPLLTLAFIPLFHLGIKMQFQVLLFEKTSLTADLILPLGYLIDLSEHRVNSWSYPPQLQKTPALPFIKWLHHPSSVHSLLLAPHMKSINKCYWLTQILATFHHLHYLSPGFLQELPKRSSCFCPFLLTHNTAGRLVLLNFKKSHSTSLSRLSNDVQSQLEWKLKLLQ